MAVRLIHPAPGLVTQLLELPREPLADLPRPALDLAPVARLDLQPLGEAALQSAQGRGIRVLDGGGDELVEQRERVVEADLRDVTRAVGHDADDKAALLPWQAYDRAMQRYARFDDGADVRQVPRRILPAITLAQFAGTSLWFAANAVMPDLQRELALPPQAVGTLTSAVQLGFIAGTLVFALLAIADRFSPRRVFLACSMAGAVCALLAALLPPQFATLLGLRAATGFFLAGIYPVGMKIAANWYTRGLGAALGVMIAALVLGTAAPHALRALGAAWPWQAVLVGVALLAAGGGMLMYLLVPDTPRAPRAAALQFRALGSIATDVKVRASVLGYFGHMWELYTFWVLVPAIVATRMAGGAGVSWAAFGIIAAGAIGCAAGGVIARHAGSARVAAVQLAASGLCCLAAPWLIDAGDVAFTVWLGLWGITVVGDSPQFSALTASNAPRDAVGSVLTLTNCIGFGISVISIEIFVRLAQVNALGSLLPWLAVGPALGLLAMRPLLLSPQSTRPG